MQMINNEIDLMVHYGITCEQKPVYRYKQYQYGKLQDAINFAKLDADPSEANLILGGECNTPLKQCEKDKH